MMKKDYMQETVNYILYYGTKISSTRISCTERCHTDSYWRESMKEALPLSNVHSKEKNYPQETGKFPEELHATNKNIKVGNFPISNYGYRMITIPN